MILMGQPLKMWSFPSKTTTSTPPHLNCGAVCVRWSVQTTRGGASVECCFGLSLTNDPSFLRQDLDGTCSNNVQVWHGGHLRPQNPVTCDHKQKNRIWVTCDHKVRSLTTTKHHIRWQGQQNLHSARGHLWPHFAVTCDQKLGSLSLIRITCTHARGGWGGWDDNVPCTSTHTSRTHHLYPCTGWVGWVGWVGWDDNVPCTCTHTNRTHNLYPCAWWVGWLG